MTVFFYNTILTTYSFFLGLTIQYYLGKHLLNLEKPHIESTLLIGNVNYATAFSAGCFLCFLGRLEHKNVQKNLVLRFLPKICLIIHTATSRIKKNKDQIKRFLELRSCNCRSLII